MNAPILTRTLLYERLRDGSFALLDFCLVNTTLGTMIEPRPLIKASGKMVNEDVYDSAFTDIQEATPSLVNAVQFSGSQWPRVYNSL